MNKNRAMSRLGLIMNWPAFNNKSSYLMPSSRSWATILVMKSSVASIVQRTLKTWLQLSFKDNTTYAQMREAVLNYDRSTTKWSEMMVLGRDSVPMTRLDLWKLIVSRAMKKEKEKGRMEKETKVEAKTFTKVVTGKIASQKEKERMRVMETTKEKGKEKMVSQKARANVKSAIAIHVVSNDI